MECEIEYNHKKEISNLEKEIKRQKEELKEVANAYDSERIELQN